MLNGQCHFILTGLLKETLTDMVETDECGEGVRLWRLFATDFEPNFDSLKILLQQSILNLASGASEDARKGVDRLETHIRQHNRTTKRNTDDDTGTGVLLRVFAHDRDWQNRLGDHLRILRSVISDIKT